MLLSIVMMMKNEERYLEKTLKALLPLRKEIESELIILDTGSEDNSVEIAKKYTDKIYFEKWNNNFADMRNKSISYASGEWLLILDADEELIEYKKLVEFFKSNLYKKFNSASLELKNISSQDNEEFTRTINLRMFKNDNFSYKGAIHEQPQYKEPIYNNIAVFNHYGYLYIDEEQRFNKIKRNEKILLDVLKTEENNEYINFQMAKNLMAIDKNKEAKYYMEKSFQLYKNKGRIPAYVYSNLAKLYITISEYDKAERICEDYIKFDDKNIDIYYYLALSKYISYKYQDSLEKYNKYIYLLDNYNISTQYNSIFCDGNTVGLRESAEIKILQIYYSLGQYNEVLNCVKKLKSNQINNLYIEIIKSLLETNNEKYLVDMYSSLTTSVEKKKFKRRLENILISESKEKKEYIYELFSKFEEDYGALNKVRLGKEITLEKYKDLLCNEEEEYYSYLIYDAFYRGIKLEDILQNVSKVALDKYFNHICKYKRKFIIDAYKYLTDIPYTLDLNKLKVYCSLCKALIQNGKFTDDKYLQAFSMYITYSYDYLRQLYNSNIDDESLMNLCTSKEDKFVINIKIAENLKNINKLDYIYKLKDILLKNTQYKKAIEILIKNFKNEFNENDGRSEEH